MSVFNAIREPWATVVAVAVTAGLGALFSYLIQPAFGIGLAVGGVVCVFIHRAARLDERPFWQHVFGRSAVYPDDAGGDPADPDRGSPPR